MPIVEGHALGAMLIAASGASLFLRMVAKEKRRRDKHLRLRVEDKIKDLQRQQEAERAQEEVVVAAEQPEGGEVDTSPAARSPGSIAQKSPDALSQPHARQPARTVTHPRGARRVRPR